MPKPALPITDEMRRSVSLLAAAGVSFDAIASTIRNPATGKAIHRKTLERLFRFELEGGRVLANQDVIVALHDSAVKKGNVSAMRFWLANVMGWRGELSGPAAKPDEEKLVVVIDHEDVSAP
jgi:hypothetical protein